MDQIKQDYTKADLSSRVRAMLDYAVKLTQTPWEMRREDIEALRLKGFKDRDILDIVEVVSYFNYINRVADALGVDPEPEWETPA